MESGKEPIKRVVFTCVNNVGRSVTLEYLFRQMLQDMGLAGKVSVSSAGIFNEEMDRVRHERRRIVEEHGGVKQWWGHPAYPGLVKALAKRGIDASKHESQQLTKEIAETADLVVCTSDDQRDAITSAYPSTKGRVHTLDELADTLDHPLPLGDRFMKPIYNPDWPLLACGDYGPRVEIMALVIEWALKEGYDGKGVGSKILSLLGVEQPTT